MNNRKGNTKGEKNGRWNGGISLYPNHYEMKQNRLIKLKQTNYKCEKCGNEAKYIHHKDKSKTNHNMDNLIVVCHRCHLQIHRNINYEERNKQINKIWNDYKSENKQSKEIIYLISKQFKIKRKQIYRVVQFN